MTNDGVDFWTFVKDWAGAILGTGAIGIVWNASQKWTTLETRQDEHARNIERLENEMLETNRRLELTAKSSDVQRLETKVDAGLSNIQKMLLEIIKKS